jgi:hypothetical protein
MSGTNLELPETMHIEGETPDEEHSSGERQESPRDKIMRGIAERAEQERQKEMAQGAVYDAEAKAAGLVFPTDEEPEPEVHEPEPAQTEARVLPTPPALAPAPDPTIRMVPFEGREYPVTDEQYQQLARLGMVTNLALHQNQQPQYTPPAEQPKTPQFTPDAQAIRDAVRQIQFGDQDAAAEALQNLIVDVVARSSVTQPYVDPEAIVQRAATVAREQAQLATDSQVIRQEYSDIFEHPQRTMLAKMNVDAIRHRNTVTGKQQSDLDIYREAGNAVRDAMNLSRPGSENPQPSQAAPTVQSRQDVIERKRAAPRATQMVDRRAPAPETPRPPSGSDIVEQMRRSRGQLSMR